MERFEELKKELLKRAKDADACKEQYARAYNTQTLEQLMDVCRDNFSWACNNAVLDIDIITQYRNEFALGNIYANENVINGFLLCSNANVSAWGYTIVEAYDNAVVEAYGSTSVRTHGNVTVEAWNCVIVEVYGSATVRAHDYAYITSYSTIEAKLSDDAIYRIRSNNTIKYANPKMKFELVE